MNINETREIEHAQKQGEEAERRCGTCGHWAEIVTSGLPDDFERMGNCRKYSNWPVMVGGDRHRDCSDWEQRT